MKCIILIHLKKGKIPSSPLAEPFGDDYSSDKNDSESTDLEYSEGDADTEAVQQPEEIEAPQPDYDESEEENEEANNFSSTEQRKTAKAL